MNKRKLKIIAVTVAVVTAVLFLGVFGLADSIKDGMFNMNTPMHITPNTTVTGTIESKEDYEAYIFDVEKDGALDVRLDHDNLLDSVKCGYKVTLYKIIEGQEREYREITYFNSFWSDVTSGWGETGVSAGTYVVTVEPGADIIFGEFTLVTTFTATTTYEKEFNDTKEAANPISVGHAVYGSSSQRTDGYDYDWFVFELSADSCINLSFVHEDLTYPKAGWNIKILTEKEELVCDFTSKLTDTVIKTGALGLRAGTYYIIIENVSPVATTYSLVLGGDKAVNHEFELNDTPETAINLPQNISMSGSLADRLLSLDKDYYKINVTENGVLEATFSHEALEGNKNGWNIRILKKEENGEYLEIVRKISAWNSKTCVISNLGLAAGEYYILIDGDSLSYNSASYTIQWSLTPRDDFETEPNGTPELAKEIMGNKKYYGAIISNDTEFDEDYYKFVITEERNVSLELGHEKVNDSSLTWITSILDENGNEVRTVESPLNEGLVNTGIITLAEGTYYIKVETGMYGSEIPYYLNLVW